MNVLCFCKYLQAFKSCKSFVNILTNLNTVLRYQVHADMFSCWVWSQARVLG